MVSRGSIPYDFSYDTAHGKRTQKHETGEQDGIEPPEIGNHHGKEHGFDGPGAEKDGRRFRTVAL